MKNNLKERAKKLRLHGLLKNWEEVENDPFIPRLIKLEEEEKQKRSLQMRLMAARTGAFKQMANFDWSWPEDINRVQIEELFSFKFIEEKANAIIVGPNGVGKTMLLKNIAYQAVLAGHTVRMTTASEMLNDLAGQEGAIGLNRRMKFYFRPTLLGIDELGYLSYDSRHADLLFEIISRRYCQKSIILTSNKPFSEWNQVFPNSSSVVALIDRLVHKSEIIQIKADSFRLKEARERSEKKNRRKQVKRKKS
ncbi:ATP-binding protein [Candidatus Riflebacteria bacterium]